MPTPTTARGHSLYNRFGIWQAASTKQGKAPSARPPAPLIARSVFLEGGEFLAVPLSMIPTDVPLACSLFVRISDRNIRLRQVGETLTTHRVTSLVERGQTQLLVPSSEWGRLLHSLEALLLASEHSTDANPVKRGIEIRDLLMAYGRQLEKEKRLTQESLERFQKLSDKLADLLENRDDVFKDLLRRYQDPALYHINHAVNVAIYCMAIAHKKGFSQADIRKLAFAALMHNVGNLGVPIELLYRNGELTVEEKNTVDTHNLLGGTLLQELGAPKEAVLTAFQHHYRYDGQGGGTIHGPQIHLFARICTVADVYDALTSHRPNQPEPLSSPLAVARMREMKGKFDPQILPIIEETSTGQ